MPLSATTTYMVYGVLSALAILLVVMAVFSVRSSLIFARRVKSENTLRVAMETWCMEHLSQESINKELQNTTDPKQYLSKEEKYWKRIGIMKEKIQGQFLNLDGQFLDAFTKELYPKIFSGK